MNNLSRKVCNTFIHAIYFEVKLRLIKIAGKIFLTDNGLAIQISCPVFTVIFRKCFLAQVHLEIAN